MSLDPRKLEVGDRIIFCWRFFKTVATTSSEFFDDIWFKGGMRLKCNDALWEQAELVKPTLPIYLRLAKLGVDGRYTVDNSFSHTPKALLELLRHDVEMLEAAKVKEEE
jgi:hypothetical protein